MRAGQAQDRGKEEDFLFLDGKWLRMVKHGAASSFFAYTRVQLLPVRERPKGYVGFLGCYHHSFHLPCSISSNLASSGLSFHLSGLILLPPLPLPRPPRHQQLGLGSCSGGKTQITLICQGTLSQAGDRCKINPALVTA